MTKRLFISFLLTFFTIGLAWCGEVSAQNDVATADAPMCHLDSLAKGADSVAYRLDDISLRMNNVASRLDSVASYMDSLSVARDTDKLRYWESVIFRHGWSINDTSIVYPPVLDFGFKAYRWLNHAFNYYDTAYVVNPGKTSGKKWKIMLKNNNWLDFYSGHLSEWRSYVQLNSDVTSLFGFQICGMGLSVSYMFNVRDLLAGKFIHNRRLQFSMTTSRFFVEGYYRKNDESTVHIYRLGPWEGDQIFSGLKRESYGLDAYYIFNHTHYSQAAAYSFSKYQKRSSGSLLGGIYLSHQDIVMDMSKLPNEMIKYLPDEMTDYRFRYRDIGVMVGYGYSWVFHHGWLYNITVVPSIGYRHSFPNSIEGKRSLLSTNLNGRMALVRTAGNFFYALTLSHEGHWYQSKMHSFYNSYNNLELTAGFRF
jgi:hypothetical protein